MTEYLCSLPGNEGMLEEVEQLRREIKQDYDIAMSLLEKAASLNYGPSMFRIGCAFDSGIGRKPDFVKAVEWYRKAAALNSADAMVNLGLMYEDGAGVDKDFEMAMMWFRKAYASNNHATAAVHIGRFFEIGKAGLDMDVEKRKEEAFNWYKAASDGDYDVGHYNMGRCYFIGIFVKIDTDKSLEYLEKACAKNNAKALHLAGSILVERGGPENVSKGREMIRKSAELGFNTAQFDLAMQYYNPKDGSEPDDEKAIFWLTKAANNRSLEAMDNLGQLYLMGQAGLPKDYSKAHELFSRAIASNYRFSFHNLGVMYLEGLGVQKDLAKAMEYFHKGAERNIASSIYHLGVFYSTGGVGIQKDVEKGIGYLTKAAQSGMAIALNDLARLYENGDGVERDPIKAKELYEQCVAKKVPEGAFNLGRMYEMGLGIPSDVCKALDYYKLAASMGYVRAAFVVGTMYEDGFDPEIEDGRIRPSHLPPKPFINVPKEEDEQKPPGNEIEENDTDEKPNGDDTQADNPEEKVDSESKL